MRPAPFVPSDVDLRDFQFTPMFRARLFGSEFHANATDAEWRAGVTLWLKSWDQVPAGSLPSDDVALCRLAELDGNIRKWRRVKRVALMGWHQCGDGRLYHAATLEPVMRAWDAKLRTRSKYVRRIEMETGIWSDIRSVVFKRDDFTCQYCGRRGVHLECDHVVPLARGGQTKLNNLVTACRSCNRSKGSKTIEEWRQ